MDSDLISVEARLRRAGALTAELIEQVAELRRRVGAGWPEAPLPPSPEGEELMGPGLARGEFRHAFSAALRSASRRPPDPGRLLPGFRSRPLR
jgi:hypothetical protein